MSSWRDLIDDLSVTLDFRGFSITSLRRRLSFGRARRVALYRHIADNLENGVTLERALSVYIAQLRKRGKHTAAGVVHDIQSRYLNGKTLSVALNGYVPASEIVLVSSGEVSGKLGVVINRMVEATDSTHRIQFLLFSAMLPPIVYIWGIYGVLRTVGTELLPSLSGATAQPVGTMGELVEQLAVFCVSPAAIIPPMLTFMVVAVTIWSLPRWTGELRRRVERFFPFSYYRDIQGYMWLIAFTSMVRANIDVGPALREQMKYATPWLRERLSRIEWLHTVNTRKLADALAESRFEFPNPYLIDDIASLAEFSDFAEKIGIRANRWAQALEDLTKQRVVISAVMFELLIFGVIFVVQQGAGELASAFNVTS